MRIKWFSLVRITGLLLVLLYHYFKELFPGGFIGVDIFFTFSGFLITALLIDEFARSNRIDLLGFLKRRFYRIVPPLVLMVLVTIPFTFLVRQDFVASIGMQIAAALGFVTNIYEILSGGNYEAQFIPHLFVHTWSLALEVHYYVLWGVFAWFLGKRSKTVGQYRGMIFLTSIVLFVLSFGAMFAGAFLSPNYSTIYFSTFTHVFPFFMGSALATVTGVNNVGGILKRLTRSMPLKKVLGGLVGSFVVLCVLSLVLKFDNLWTYLVGFLASTILGTTMILMTRILHEKTPKAKEPKIISFIADTSYGVYLFHWPFYVIFSQVMNNGLTVLSTTILSFSFAALSFYILEPMIAGRKPKLFGMEFDFSAMIKPLLSLSVLLTVVLLVVVARAPKVGPFETDLMVNALNQSDKKMMTTRRLAENAKASKFEIADGMMLIGDSVSLRAAKALEEAFPDAQLDSQGSRNIAQANDILKNSIENGNLVKNVVITTGVNVVNNYEEELKKTVEMLPKGYSLIFVTPYDGNSGSYADPIAEKHRQVELALAEEYDFITIADWYTTSKENPQIWAGSDNIHFGGDGDTMAEGAKLYAQTIKEALKEAAKKPVKGGK
ncbi:acyltransferase family protein [Streptococcus himalayensis]|uniref:Acyltransferase n=1 Tax=Streptococcus himalayensis TaxID=1888195 RepID=A0A917A662_9STRE|nr:acyltransferase family protein [Streptococcus himalayensis]GGE30572.1 acyltransferase [Streptococcus himalayensis]